jgi:hypothetical protein
MGSVARVLGRLAAVLERWRPAEEHFDLALQMHEGLKAKHFVAHTQRAYAEMLILRDAAADRQRAGKLLDEAIASYTSLGMDTFRQRALAMAEGDDGIQRARVARRSQRT